MRITLSGYEGSELLVARFDREWSRRSICGYGLSKDRMV